MTTKKETVRLGWHIAIEPRLTHGDNRKIVPGAVFSVEGPISVCSNGLHASPTIERALGYVRDSGKTVVVSFVEVWGDVRDQNSKFCGRFRRHIAVGEITGEEQEEIYTKDNREVEARVMYRVLANGTSFSRTARVQLDTVKRIKGSGLYGSYEKRALESLKRKRNGNGRKARKAA